MRRDVAQPGRALPWGGRGRQFESARPDQFALAKRDEAVDNGQPQCDRKGNQLLNRSRKAVLIAFVALSAFLCGAQSANERLQIKQSADSYELNVPISQLTMTIPKGGLVQTNTSVGGSTNNPRYFLFEDKDKALVISGWFEPAQGFPGIQKFWAGETGAWAKRGLPEAKDVSFTKIGSWDAILYDIRVPKGNNSHIRAHWVEAGTWIDIHLSLTSESSNAELRTKLESLLKDIQVKAK